MASDSEDSEGEGWRWRRGTRRVMQQLPLGSVYAAMDARERTEQVLLFAYLL
jgi:hypothetical protein